MLRGLGYLGPVTIYHADDARIRCRAVQGAARRVARGKARRRKGGGQSRPRPAHASPGRNLGGDGSVDTLLSATPEDAMLIQISLLHPSLFPHNYNAAAPLSPGGPTCRVPFEALALNALVTFAAGFEPSAPTIRGSPILFRVAAVPIHMLLGNLSGGSAGKAYSAAAVAAFPSHQSLSWRTVSPAPPWRGISGFLGPPWVIVSLGVLERIDAPLRGPAHRPRAKRGQSLIRREISKQFRINVDRTDCDLKVCGLAHKIRSILSIRQQRRNRLERRRWQTHHNALGIHLSAFHAPIYGGGHRVHQKVH